MCFHKSMWINLKVSDSGAYCDRMTVHHYTDTKLIQKLKDIVSAQSVISFGEGIGSPSLFNLRWLGSSTGAYRAALLPYVSSYRGFDGTPGIFNITNGTVEYLDLTIPQYGINASDYVLSLEVGEHIPREFEQIFLDNIARHAVKGTVVHHNAVIQSALE